MSCAANICVRVYARRERASHDYRRNVRDKTFHRLCASGRLSVP